MGKGYDLLRIIEKLQRPRGYQGCRIRPHPTKENLYLAEMQTESQAHRRKIWKPLLSDAGDFCTFASSEEAQQALIQARGELFSDSRPFYIQLQLCLSDEILWRQSIFYAEQEMSGSAETMIEDAATRLTAAMRELRVCKSQKRANELHEIIIGQSHRLSHLAGFVNREAKRLQWCKVHPKGSE
jgi:hypothetical protein